MTNNNKLLTFKFNRLWQSVAVSTGVLCLSPVASAQDTGADDFSFLEEVIVTAERRSTSVQKIALSVNVQDGEDLRQKGKYQLRDIIENIPGITGGAAESANGIAGGGTDTAGSGIVIRGMQSNSGVGGSSTSVASSVAVYTDDVYEGIGGSYDLNRVEILRGPQGTLYGRSATGGVVALRTADPSFDGLEGFVLTEGGTDGLQHYSGAVNVPLVSDVAALRISGDYYERDGFDSEDGVGSQVHENARIKLLVEPNENLSILLGMALQNNEEGTGGNSWRMDVNGHVSATPEPLGDGTNEFRQFWANINYQIGELTLTYIPSYRTWEQDAEIVAAGPGFTISQNLETPEDDFITHEIRLASADDAAIKWQVGALSYYNDLENTNSVSFNLPGNPLAFSADTQKETEALGVFGEATYALTDTFRITAGLRYDETDVTVAQDYTNGNFGTELPPITLSLDPDLGNREFENWTYKLRGEFDLSEESLLYVSYSTGFTPGDASVTTDSTGQPLPILLEDQTLKAFEIGSKNRLFDNRVQINGSLFYYDYSGYQTAGIDTDPNPVVINFQTLVSEMEMFGGELEVLYQASENGTLGFNLGYTDAQFVDSSAEFETWIAEDELAGLPPLTASLTYDHDFILPGDSTLTAGLQVRYLSSHTAGTINQASVANVDFIEVDNTFIGDINLVWSSPQGAFTVTGYVRNIGDERYFLDGDYDASLGSGTVTLSAPRTAGAVFSYNF